MNCALLTARGLIALQGPDSPRQPCKTCVGEWENGQPPTDERLTPTLKAKLAQAKQARLPGLFEMAANFASSIALWAWAGFPVTTREEFLRRFGICRECEHWNGSRCVICGCFQVKPWLKTAACPDEPPRW